MFIGRQTKGLWYSAHGSTDKQTVSTILTGRQTNRQLFTMLIGRQTHRQSADGPRVELATLQEELIAVRMREAEAQLAVKELRQRVHDLDTVWQVSFF